MKGVGLWNSQSEGWEVAARRNQSRDHRVGTFRPPPTLPEGEAWRWLNQSPVVKDLINHNYAKKPL